jgi:dUTP pyrophosphatase
MHGFQGYTIINTLKNTLGKFGILKIAIPNNELREHYVGHIDKHNNAIQNDQFPNAGFDLFVPEVTGVPNSVETAKMISMDVKCEMVDPEGKSIAYYMYPRSSLSKTPLILANHVGIIDSGYRGPLIGAFRNVDKKPYIVDKHTRLLQVCHPSLYPIYVILVDESELSTTSRGSGGFGSTGI